MITNTSILVLNDFSEKNIPVITDSTGKVEYAGRDFNFHSGFRTEVKFSCSVTFRGEFYVFGGDHIHNYQQMRQILKVTDCSIEKVGKLRFDFRYGACAAVNEESIYLCFSDRDGNSRKQCYVGTDPVGPFSKTNQSQFSHDLTRIAASEGSYFNLNYLTPSFTK